MKKIFTSIGLCLGLGIVVIGLAACGGTSPQAQEAAQAQSQQSIYNNVQPVHTYNWSLPRQLMQDYYDASVQQVVTTYSYVWNDYLGQVTFSCMSEGYPTPGGTQLTNPNQITAGKYQNLDGSDNQATGTISQMDPNGLYPPASGAYTIVYCVMPSGKVSPQYFENNVITTTFPMHVVDHQLVPVDSKQAGSIEFDTKKH
jgi:hypothetical protein